MRTEHDKCTTDVFNIGDILYGTSYMYGNITYYYRVVGRTAKRLKLKELQKSYSDPQMRNSISCTSMPVLEYPWDRPSPDGHKVRAFFEGHPYWDGIGADDTVVEADVQCVRYVDSYTDHEEYGPWRYQAKVRGKGKYFPLLEKWDGRSGSEICT